MRVSASSAFWGQCLRPLALLLVASCTFNLAAGEILKAEKNHPLKNAKIGDWVEYKVTQITEGRSVESTERMEIVKKEGNIVAFSHSKRSGATNLKTETPLYLDVPCDPEDPRSPLSPAEVKNVKYELLGKGDEKLKVNEYEFNCSWTKRNVAFDSGNASSAYISKVWKSKDVPLFGWVKREFEYSVPVKAVVTYELIGHGRGK